MRLVFTPDGWEDYLYWQRTDRSVLNRLNRLINDVLRDPFTGIGKPEPLRNVLAGYWSRRVDDEHRLVYLVDGDDIVVIQARTHYGK
jgi:toxin YoeB